MKNGIEGLKAFLDSAVSPYHGAAQLQAMLEEAGFVQVHESQLQWELVPGGRYYLIRGGSSVIAFRIPKQIPSGFMISTSHCDRPAFKVKENGELTGTYTRLGTEKYGGIMIFPWLDRPLSIAGRVAVETEQGVQSRLVNIDRDLLLIPNVAIHMNREVNEGYRWNPAVDTIPLLGGPDAAGKLEHMLEQEAGGKILGRDLYLYVRQKAAVWGVDEEYISAAGLDDLACVWSCAQGFLQAEPEKSISVLCVFDNEEIGSGTFQGADSNLLIDTLRRICGGRGLDLRQMLAQTFMVSADNAQALHPNHPELSDPGHGPVVNAGVVLKFHADRKYTTDGLSAGIFRRICAKANAPLQVFYNRADMKSGSTLGIELLTHVSVNAVDIGLPQLAMHSCYETAGVKDALSLVDIMKTYYSSALEVPADGNYIVK